MTFLFRYRLPLRKKLRYISTSATSHGLSLFYHAFLYKLVLYLLSLTTRLNPSQLTLSPTLQPFSGTPLCPYHSIIGGMLGGYFIWGRDTPINRQITLYLLSRVLYSGVKSLSQSGVRPFSMLGSDKRNYPLVSCAVWGVVMYMFETGDRNMQGSLRRSMEEIYRRDGSGGGNTGGNRRFTNV